ncbi:MAG: hypothetical protein WBE76_11200 [Terracidiphilus sp.]
MRFGVVLTGDKLIDNIDFRHQLRAFEPEAIGGEMEGAGLYVACQDKKVDWILVKAICDWADGSKTQDKDSRQQLAATNAARFVLRALQFTSFSSFQRGDLKPDAIHAGQTDARDIFPQVNRAMNTGRVFRKLPFPTLAELFVGRNEEIARLDQYFWGGGAASLKQPVALIGGGGVGKTRLALEYAFRHDDDFIATLLVSANTPDDLKTNMARLCAPDALALIEGQLPTQPQQCDAVLHWLQGHRNWLLIIDNVDTDEAVASVQSLIGSLPGGQIIITTRITEWGGCAHEFTLDAIPQPDAARFLLRSTANRRVTREDDMVQAQTLANRLGCLPLMLTHASAYIRRYGESIAGYLSAFERKLPVVLSWHDHNAIKYEADPTKDRVVKTVATTYFMAFDKLSSVEKSLLRLAGFLAPYPIPVSMFEQHPAEVLELVKLWCEETGEQLSDKPIRDALAELAHVSLITQMDGAFEIHRVEQRILDSRVLPPWRDKWAQAVITLVQAHVPSNSHDPMSSSTVPQGHLD